MAFFCADVLTCEEPIAPPTAPRHEHSFLFHGRTMTDPYAWIKDKKNPETIKYLKAENEFLNKALAHLKPFEDTLYKEILSHVKQTDQSAPVREGQYWYYTRTVEGKQYPLFCRKAASENAPEEIMLDVNQLAQGQAFMSARPVGVSDNGRLFAYLTDTTGFREYYLTIKDLHTGQLLEDRSVKVREVTWTADPNIIFYVTEDHAKRPHKLYRHVVGTPVASDHLVFEEKDERFELRVGRTQDKKYIIRSSTSSNTSEHGILPADRPTEVFRVVAMRREGIEYSIDHRDGLLHIVTNQDGAVNFKWMYTRVDQPTSEHWKDWEPYNPKVFMESLTAFKDHAVVSEREAGLTQIRIHDFKNRTSHRIIFPEECFAAVLGDNRNFETSVIRFEYSSLTTPDSVFDYDMNTKKKTLIKQIEIPGGFSPSNYVTERVEATSHDGTKVPMSLVYRKGIQKNGEGSALLYGYGSYGSTTEPTFDAERLVLLDRGVIFAIAHIRGGSEMGRPWYLDGKLMKKKNTFADFIACADYLVNQKYCARSRLAIEGASAGGLLIGAVINARPDVCKVAHLGVPFVDVINTMLDEDLPLTVQEFLEWGDPKEPAAGQYMLEYSPYDNLASKKYPAILVTTSLNDSQVLYHEPAKYMAKLRAVAGGRQPAFLKCNMDAGHGGASGRYDSIRERAFELSFMLDQVGIKK